MKRNGATLIEVVVTASILAVVFLVLLNILPASLRAVRQSEHRQAASALTQAILDECRARPFADLTTDMTVTLTTAGALGDMLRRQNCQTNDAAVLVPELQISGVAGIPRNHLARLQVRVSWSDRNGRQLMSRELQLSPVQR